MAMMDARALESGWTADEDDDTGVIRTFGRASTSETQRAIAALQAQPALRALSAPTLATRLGIRTTSARSAIASLVGRAVPGVSLGSSDGSLDSRLVAVGRPRSPLASPRATGPSGGRIHILIRPLTRRAFDSLLRAVPPLRQLSPEKLRSLAGVDLSDEASGIDPSNPAKYIVEAGDFPFKISQKLTSDQSGSHWKDLINANPQKPTGSDGNFTSLFAGESLNVPQFAPWPVAAPAAPPPPGAPAPAPAPSVPGAKFDYIVQAGDFPTKIATKIVGNAARWIELKASNPHKAIQPPGSPQPGNFVSLVAGEILHLPDSWSSSITFPPQLGVIPAPPGGLPLPPSLPPTPPNTPPSASPAPPLTPIPVPPPGAPPALPGAPPLPGLPAPTAIPGLPPGTVADAGVYGQVQALLAAWMKFNKLPPLGVPQDFGTTPAEFTGSETLRSKQALGSYQVWANQNKSAGLRTDGALDIPTYTSLTSTVGELLGAGGGQKKKKSSSGSALALIGAGLGALQLLK